MRLTVSTSVISAMEQSKHNELKFICPPGTSPFKAPSDVAEMNEALQESLENDFVLSFTIPKGRSRRNAMNICHHASNTFIRKVTLQARTAHPGLRQSIILETDFPPVVREPQVQNSKNGQTSASAWRTWTAKELTRKQRNTMHWKIYRKMIDWVRQKAAAEEKKKRR